MKAVLTSAALVLAGAQADAAVVSYTYKSGPMQVSASCETEYGISCSDLTVPTSSRPITFEAQISVDTDYVIFNDGIGTISWESDIGLFLSGPIRLINLATGETYLDGLPDELRSITVTVDTLLNIVVTELTTEFYNWNDGSLWYVDVTDGKPNVWAWEPSMVTELGYQFTAFGPAPSPVPVPASAMLLLGALAGLRLVRRRS